MRLALVASLRPWKPHRPFSGLATTSNKLQRPNQRRTADVEAAAVFHALPIDPPPSWKFGEPQITGNVDESAKMPANIALEAEVNASIGIVHANVNVRADSNSDVRLGGDASVDGFGKVSLSVSPGEPAATKLYAEAFGIEFNSSGKDGSPGFSASGKHLKGEHGDDRFEGGISVDGFLSADFCQEGSDFEAKANICGLISSLERKSVDASGRKEISTTEYDQNGDLKHYYGEIEETTGTVDATYLGAGIGTLPGEMEASAQLKFNVCNDYNQKTQKQTHEISHDDGHRKEVNTSATAEDKSSLGIFSSDNNTKVHKQQQSTDVMDNKAVESKITTDTVDNSKSVLGKKYSGEETTRTHTETTTTTTDQGFFGSKVTKEKQIEDVEYTQRHSVLDSEIDITGDTVEVEREMEYLLNEAGLGCLVMLIKPAVKVHKQYMDQGTLECSDVLQAVAQTGVGVVGLAAMSRLLGSGNAAMAVAMLASIVPKIQRGDMEGVSKDLQKLAMAILVSRSFSLGATGLLHCVGLSPVAKMGGTAAGILGSSIAATYLNFDEILRRLQEERKRYRRLKLAA